MLDAELTAYFLRKKVHTDIMVGYGHGPSRDLFIGLSNLTSKEAT